jgi:membrane peptidoglycan carboxypeptidase
VLEWYLNHAHYGRHAYGAEAAAQLYFGKSADGLRLAESALLAAVSEAPALNPLDASRAAMQRGRETLRLVAELGMIPRHEAEIALAESVVILPGPETKAQFAAAFINLVLAQLDTQIPRARLERGGLNIITTLDHELQAQVTCVTEVYVARLSGLPEPEAECEARRGLAALPPGLTIADASASALVLEAQTGQVLALVGETLQGKETPLFSAHDPGSLMDAFVYLTGFTTGLGPGSLVWDVPAPGDEGLPAPDGVYRGPVRLRMAMANDLRAPAERMRVQMGTENVAQVMGSFGLRDEEALSPVQLAGAFAALGTQGVYFGQQLGEDFSPVSVLRVEAADDALLLDWSIPKATAIVPPALAYLMTDALSDEPARVLTLGSPNVLELGLPAAVKLGRSDDRLNAWSIGYSPQRAVSAWTGTHGGGAALAARIPAVLFAAVMEYASRELPADGWAMPAGISAVTVCDPSGMLPRGDCPALVQEIFLEGNEPQQPDNLFRRLLVNRETGFLATVFTPPQLVEEQVYLAVPPEALAWAAMEGLPIPPDSYDAIQAPHVNPDVNITTPALFEDVRGRVRILGTAAGEGFDSYRVLVGSGLNPQEWFEVAQSSTPVVGGLLAEWDTSALSGLYAVQLAVRRGDDRLETALTQVTVEH